MSFPYLYHTMYLSSSAHLEALAEHPVQENVLDSLSVPFHLKYLIFGSYIQTHDIHYLNSIVPRLICLKYLSWESEFAPESFSCFSACSQLESVHLVPEIS
ncbi:hypothetical protein RSAG8_06249, partial [Rhizoctonia solani AG-8 WAC10335]